MNHDPTAAEILAIGMGTSTVTWALAALAANGLAIVEVGEAPPWMRLVERDAQQFGHDLYIMRDES